MFDAKSLITKTVYLKTDRDFLPRIVTKYEQSLNSVVFCLAQGDNSSWHQIFEFTEDLDSIKTGKTAGFKNE